MFRCELCRRSVGPGVPCHMIAKLEPYQHPFREFAGQRWEWDDRKHRWKYVWYKDYGGPGKQIVKETRVCPSCARSLICHAEKHEMAKAKGSETKTVIKPSSFGE